MEDYERLASDVSVPLTTRSELKDRVTFVTLGQRSCDTCKGESGFGSETF